MTRHIGKCKTKVPKKYHTTIQVLIDLQGARGSVLWVCPGLFPPTSAASCPSLSSSPTPVSPRASLRPLFYPSGFRQLLPPRLPEASKEGQRTQKTSHLSLLTAVTQQHRSDGKVLPAFPQHFRAADHRVQSSENLDIILKVSSERVQIATFQSLIVTQI